MNADTKNSRKAKDLSQGTIVRLANDAEAIVLGNLAPPRPSGVTAANLATGEVIVLLSERDYEVVRGVTKKADSPRDCVF